MDSNLIQESDFLVIGSGIAGLYYALHVADHGSVTIATKLEPSESSTKYAQGGIATVLAQDDSFDSHIEDTLRVGAGLCHEEVVRFTVEEGPRHIERLMQLGVAFTTHARQRLPRPGTRRRALPPPGGARHRSHRAGGGAGAAGRGVGAPQRHASSTTTWPSTC